VDTIIAASPYREKALKNLGKLPPFSPILNKLVATISDDDVSFVELADLIEKDIVLAGNVLRTVNSALYGRRGTINSVRHAVSLMGLAKIRNVTMSLSLARMWSSTGSTPGWFPAQFNLHAVACAILADQLAAELPVEYPEGAFTAGLLANIGMMLVAISLPEERQQIEADYLSGGGSLEDCERKLLGLTHADLSMEVLQQWNLPLPIQLAVLNHHGRHRITETGVTLSYVLEQADVLSLQLAIPVQPWIRPDNTHPVSTLANLGVPEELLQSFKAEFDTIRAFFR